MKHKRLFVLRRATAIGVGLVCHAHALQAQTPPTGFVGRWAVTWDAGIKTRNGKVVAVQRRAEGVLELTMAGDSLQGTWNDGVLGPDSRTARTVQVTAKQRGDTIAIVSVPGTAGPTVAMFGTRDREGMSGILYLQLNGPEAPARKWEARPIEPMIRKP